MISNEHEELADLDDAELAALHEVELGIEHLHRAHGHLVAFHHSTGRGMNHLAAAEERLRTAGYERLADEIRDEYLPRGVLEGHSPRDRGRWSYDVLETYERVFLDDIVDFGERVCLVIADGLRHANERKQEMAWKRRANPGHPNQR